MARKDSVIEGGTTDMGYRLEVAAGGKLLRMALRGYWSPALAKVYQTDIRQLWAKFGATSAALVDVRQSPIQSTGVAALRSEIISEAIQKGLQSVAYVTNNTLAKMQMRRIALQGGCKAVECFDDEPAATAWVTGILQGSATPP